MSSGLTLIDWLIIVVYAGSTLFLGWYFGKRQKSTREYFVGSGKMNPVLIGVSLFASLLSTITYLSIPGETIGKGPIYLTTYLAYPFVFLIVGFVLLPVYMKNRVTSAYELLEERLGLGIRLLGAVMFLVLRLVWMSLLIYLTARALVTMIGLGREFIPLLAVATGAIAITYASMGGLRAVVVTDLMQTLLLYGGALLVIATVTVRMGGFGWFPTEWAGHWDTQPLVSFDPKTRVTVLGSVLSVLIYAVATAGGDQVSVQRFMATGDARSARRAVGLQLLVGATVGLTLGIAGFALLGYFQANPGLLADELHPLEVHADQIFPHFIAHGLPPVVSGLVLSGLFAAAMSSVDSGVNSITAVVTTDFVDRFRKKARSEREHLWLARILAAAVGVIVVIGSSFMQHVPGNITAVTTKTVNLLTVPIFCLFFFALFVKFARPAGVWAGWLAGTTVAASIAFSGPLALFLFQHFAIDPAVFGTELIRRVHPETGAETLFVPDPVSFQWISPLSLLVNLTVGTLVSLALPKRPR